MSTNTSIGGDGSAASNESHGNADGCGNKTLGEDVTPQPAAGTDGKVERNETPTPAAKPTPAGQR